MKNPRRSRSAKPFRSNNKKEWMATTKLGRLVKNGYVSTLEEIFRHNIAITETEIIDYLTRGQVKEEVFAVYSVVKQTPQGSRTRFKTLVAVGDRNGHVGLGIKCYKEVASAIRGAVTNAKLSLIHVVRGNWVSIAKKNAAVSAADENASVNKNHQQGLHTISGKTSGDSGSTKVRLLPAPRGTGIVGAVVQAQITLLNLAGVKDCFVASNCSTNPSCVGNQLKATLNALQNLNRLNNETENREKMSPFSSDEDNELPNETSNQLKYETGQHGVIYQNTYVCPTEHFA